jgi:uncharacterized BrkB/YihY/UPF0761 family membrane protein
MTPNEIVIPPPSPRLIDYPGSLGIGLGVIFTTALLFVAGRFDPTHGVLTISLLVVLAFLGVVAMCLFFTIPSDEITSGVIGGLVAAFGAVIAHWIGRSQDGPK